MSLKKNFSPIEINTHNFRTVLKGFDKEDVKLFLNAIAESYQELIVENTKLMKEVERLSSHLEEFQKRENLLKDALYLAQKTSDEVKSNAEKEAKNIVKDAELRADQFLRDALLRTNKIEREILDIKVERENALTALKDLIERLSYLVKAVEEKKNRENVEVISKE